MKNNKKRKPLHQKKNNLSKTEPKAAISPAKKKLFILITFSIPVIFLMLLESGLRIFNYGGNLDLFIEGPPGYEQYLRANPDVARRYFVMQKRVPTPPKQLFLKQKPDNGFRIFVLGESSTAGFPYGYNACFSNILERGLQNTFPDKYFEVINVAMAAINSYTLLDLLDEVIEQSPDAIIIYTGHNEYYGAMGVGSEESTGISRWLTILYLDLRSYRTFLLVRNFIGWAKESISKIFYGSSEVDPSQTLMERIVAEQTIPSGSGLYKAGIEQFKKNMDAILEKTSIHKIPVILSELVSNIRDQKPFISVKDFKGESAETVFNQARREENNGDFETAKQNYFKAKDLDALRFRAPERFNIILHELAQKYSYPIVPMESYFEKNSPNGLIGNSLMLEHLHPNKEGHFLMAKAFYDLMQKNNFISSSWKYNGIDEERNKGITDLDSVCAELQIRFLKGGWPFQPKSLPNHFLKNFVPHNYLEDIAFRVLKGTDFSMESAHMELGNYYQKRSQLDKAFKEYFALLTSIPQEMEFYRKAVLVLLEEKKYEQADSLLQKSLKYTKYPFAYKWIGQIAMMNEDFKKAISYLSRADFMDQQVVFNLSRAYYMDNQWYKGEEFFNRLKNLSPRQDYLAYLNKLRNEIRMKYQKK
jgi:tetratricopeptide (TPR) repeat protein